MIQPISIKQLREIERAKLNTKDPTVDRKLTILALRGNGAVLKEIAAQVGCSLEYASNIIKIYHAFGLEGVINSYQHKSGSGLSFEEEQRVLAPFIKRTENCELVNSKEIAVALRAEAPHPLSQSQIYAILHRHGWHRGSFRKAPNPSE